MESVGNDIISYSRAKEIVTAYENAMIEENYRNNRAREEGYDKGHEEGLEQGHQEGLQQGIEKGIEQGIEQGLQQGLQQGIEKGSKESKFEIAKMMLGDNVSMDVVSKYTGLSLEELKNII